ncbi:MAG TPA: alpha/beta hydrolase [Magnetospirillum sp.]|nr:alpha/beta hydrolase [Magnetospirillum sp.]
MFPETLGVFAGGYALLVGGLAIFQRDMIYHPGTSLPDPGQVGVPEMTPVPVRTSDGMVVTGWYAAPADPARPTVVYCHGNARTLAERAHKARLLLDAGYGVFLVGYRGYGGNPGRPSEQGLYADARAVVGWVMGRDVPMDKVVLYGESLGTGVAVQLATELPDVRALVLEAPFTRLPDLAPAYVPPAIVPALMLDHYDSLAKIGGITAPLLIMHGEHDGIVPIAMGRRMLDAAHGNAEGLFLAEAGHNNLWEHGAGDAVLAFIERVSA